MGKGEIMYYIVGTKKQFNDLQGTLNHILSERVLASLFDKVALLDEYYGSARDLQKDLGGYCVVFPTIEDCTESYRPLLDKHYIQNEMYEYRKEHTDGDCCWIEELYMISSDYGLVLFYLKNSETKGGAEEQ